MSLMDRNAQVYFVDIILSVTGAIAECTEG